WYENFRVRRHTFKYLCKKLRPHIEKETTRLRYPISVELRVAVTLWFLATSTDYRTLSHLFGISKASACMIV
uniref:Transposase Helix-turn-helix domain-containing protein n=1 Tax=Amphimedon queenslandica TaxID=400682 RepID=A0A1X7TZ97_AMPQE